MKNYFIASCSCGKDSLAMVYKLIELKCPLDEIVMYDTGMVDINQKEVFTKDIVKAKSTSTGEEKIYWIDFDNTRFHFGFCEINHGYIFNLDELLEKELGDELSIEVIGNTIDNPELLESTQPNNFDLCRPCKYFSTPFNGMSACTLKGQAIEDIETCQNWEDQNNE